MAKGLRGGAATVLALKLADEFATFLRTVFGPAANNVSEILGNETALWKIKNALKIRQKLEALRSVRGITDNEFAEMRIGVPLIERAINEDNELLQDMWAGLLAASMGKAEILHAEKSFVHVVSSLDPDEADLLNDMYRRCSEWFDKGGDGPQQSFIITVESGAIKNWFQFRNLERLWAYKDWKSPRDTWLRIFNSYD